MNIFLDVETIGFHGVPVLLQYAIEDNKIELYDLWLEECGKTIELLEWLAQQTVIGFNLAFDWFHINKFYTMLLMLREIEGPEAQPVDFINLLGTIEKEARFLDCVLKPHEALDLMLHARKGPFQSLMERDPIRIKRVPKALAEPLTKELEKRIILDDVYFARSKKPWEPRWKIFDIKRDGKIDKDFVDIQLKFKASTALKALARYALKIDPSEILKFSEVEVPEQYRPDEYGFAPFALAVTPEGADGYWISTKVSGLQSLSKKTQGKKKLKSWPALVKYHIEHWAYNAKAREYGTNDVDYTRRLYHYFGTPAAGDDDSTLACMVACCRWKGFAINRSRLLRQRAIAVSKLNSVPRAPHVVKRYLLEVMDATEAFVLEKGTKKVILEAISKWQDDNGNPHPAAIRAKDVLDARKSEKKIQLIDKLLLANRLHASFRVIGALSGRMSGADGLNPQGIDHTLDFRRCFDLADFCDDFDLCIGDFKSFEVSLAATVFQDPDLDATLISGKKIHALFGMQLYPGNSYEQICASEGKDPDMYDHGKKGVFAIFYGGETYTIATRLGIPEEVAQRAFDGLYAQYKGIGRFGKETAKRFCALSQPGGLGSRVIWNDPEDYAETFLGFRRYFTLEHRITKALFELAESPPEAWKQFKFKVHRRTDRIQVASGATQSALFGAAFKIAQAIVRQAKNHFIQSPGAQITKALQRAIWDIQPAGPSPWIVQPYNVHDEVACPTRHGYQETVAAAVVCVVERYKKKVKLLAIDWVKQASNWSGKKGGITDAEIQIDNLLRKQSEGGVVELKTPLAEKDTAELKRRYEIDGLDLQIKERMIYVRPRGNDYGLSTQDTVRRGEANDSSLSSSV
jgi:hypothetical protein